MKKLKNKSLVISITNRLQNLFHLLAGKDSV